ncbi:lipocalin family protein [Profundibacter sp.]
MLRRFFLTALITTPLVACVPNPEGDPPPIYKSGVDPAFIGRWIEVLLGGDGGGFELFADGTAASIEPPDLTYVSWRAEAGKLFLTTAESIGNAIKTTEVEYSAQFDDVTSLHLDPSLHLDQGGKDDWSRVFRMIN